MIRRSWDWRYDRIETGRQSSRLQIVTVESDCYLHYRRAQQSPIVKTLHTTLTTRWFKEEMWNCLSQSQ